MTRKLQLNQVQNVAPGSRATIRLPLGQTYNKIVLFFGGNILASLITNIVLKVNGSERLRWDTAAHLQARNSYNLGASDPQVLEMDFMERNAKDEGAMTLGAYAATAEAGVQDMTLEFDIGAYTVTAASTVKGIAEVDVPSANKLIVRNRGYSKVLAGAVEEQIIIPFGQQGEQLKRLYIFGTLSLIESLRIRREGADEFEALTVPQNEYFQKTYGKIPQAGLMVIDMTEHNLQGHLLNTAMISIGKGPDGKDRFTPIQNLDIRLKTTGAGTFKVYTEAITLNDRP